MSKPRGLIWKTVALVVIIAGAAFILDAAPPDTPTNAAPSPQPTHTALIKAAIQPTALPPTPLPAGIEPTNTAAPQQVAVIPAVQVVERQPGQPNQQPVEAPTVLPAPPVKPVPNQVTIQFAPGTTAEEQQAYIQQLGGTISQRIDALHTVVVSVPDVAAAQTFQHSPLVVQTEPDFYVTAQQSTPNDPYISQQWALPVMQVPDAWSLLPANAPTVAVAVIDSGICATHPDLAGKILPGYDFVQSDSTPQDEYGHGCEVSGIIAADVNNGIGIAGVAPNARIMPLRVLDANGNGYYSNVAAAITYAADNGAQIINISLGGDVPSTTLQNAVDYATAHGVMVVAAAGNTNGGPVMYPAAYPNVVAVASIDSDLQPSSFSAVGPEVDLRAPGRNILTTTLNANFVGMNGTSFAAPQVAAIAALEIGRGKSLIIDGGIVHADIPAPEPTITPSPVADKHGNTVIQQTEVPPDVPTDTWAVILEAGSDPNAVASELGFENLGQIGNLANTYLFRAPNLTTSLAAQGVVSALGQNSQIIWFQQQILHQQQPRDPSDDPLYADQWHLHNAPGVAPDNNANVVPAWNAGFTGAGVQIAIVDDGLQYTHPDLANNVLPGRPGSYDFNQNDDDPMPGPSNSHGTAAAGVAAASDNTACGVGAAYNANLAGIRLIAGGTSDTTESLGLSFAPDINDIYSNSWGPSDDGSTLRGPGPLTLQALQNGVSSGRGGKGNIYVWAAGNGRAAYIQGMMYDIFDNVNADGYANSRFVISVGAVDPLGRYSYYSEPGAAMFITAPSSAIYNGPVLGITTTDLMGAAGYNDGIISGEPADTNCTRRFGGTSASTPLVSGVIALMLESNPNLTWRDVRYILAQTAKKNDESNPDWTTNAAGYHINHNYGFGMVDAGAAVTAAQTWTNVPDEAPEADSGIITVNQPILSSVSGGGTISTVDIPDNLFLENVEVVFNATHSWRGDIEVILTSPSGTQSRLMEPRQFDGPPYQPAGDDHNFTNWKFMTVRNWGEHSAGTWTLTVVDRFPDGDSGTFQNWRLILHGTAAPPIPPVPIAPANNAVFNTPLPWYTTTFAWNNISSADHLELQLDTVNPPVAAPIIISGTPSSYIINMPLGTYYWRLRALDTDPTTTEPDWADIPVRTFTIQTSTNIAPPRNYFTTASPTLTWTYITWATAYQIEISTSSTFAPASRVYISPDGTPPGVPFPSTQLSFTVLDAISLPAGLPEGVYFWRVRGRKADGTWSTTWSAYDSFIVDLP